MEVIRLEERHLREMEALEQLCFPQDPWPGDLLASALGGEGVLALGLCREGRLWGAALGRLAADEAELHSIAVHPARQGEGWGRRLLLEFLAEVRARQGRVVWLEVRASNEPALRLYHRAGFTATGRRPRYYSDGEDALLFCLKLDNDID
ncbi:MAG: ribosomal protein S18-alanine N-acetyltransferase [Candidatus Delongbacteria bacterium]